MNAFELNKKWFSFSFENKDAKPIHTAIYMYAIEHCNKLGWKKEFGFPTDLVMEVLSIKSYNTYSKALKDLVDFGFIEMVEKSKNQWSSNVIALLNFNKANIKALDKATPKHMSKQSESTIQSTCQSNDSIIKLLNKETIKLINIQTERFCAYVEKHKNEIFELEKIEEKIENDFFKKICQFFSQTTEPLERKVWSCLNHLRNQNKYPDFKKQTLAYIDYKKASEEKIHSWNGYYAEWENQDWIDKLQKQKNKSSKKSNKGVLIN